MFFSARWSLIVLPVVTTAPVGCCQMRWRVLRFSMNPCRAMMGAMGSRRAMGQSSWVNRGRREIASSCQRDAWAPASQDASTVMGTCSPMVCCASSVGRPAHTIWRVVRHEAGVMIMRGMRWSGGGAQRHSVSDTSHISTARRSAYPLVICRPADRALPPTHRVRARADRGRMRRDMV